MHDCADRNIPFAPGEYKHLKRKNECRLTVRKFLWGGGESPLGLNLAPCVDFAQAAVSASKQSRGGYEEFDTKGGKERMPRSTESLSEKKQEREKKNALTHLSTVSLFIRRNRFREEKLHCNSTGPHSPPAN